MSAKQQLMDAGHMHDDFCRNLRSVVVRLGDGRLALIGKILERDARLVRWPTRGHVESGKWLCVGGWWFWLEDVS